MSTVFPGALDTFVDPIPLGPGQYAWMDGSIRDGVTETANILIAPNALLVHSFQHAHANDAIAAIEAKVGIDNSADATSLDSKVRSLGFLTEHHAPVGNVDGTDKFFCSLTLPAGTLAANGQMAVLTYVLKTVTNQVVLRVHAFAIDIANNAFELGTAGVVHLEVRIIRLTNTTAFVHYELRYNNFTGFVYSLQEQSGGTFNFSADQQLDLYFRDGSVSPEFNNVIAVYARLTANAKM